MEKFLSIAKTLGWEPVVENILVFKKDLGENIRINFTTSPLADLYMDSDNVDKKFVDRYINYICCSTVVSKKDAEWATLVLISDFYGHRGDFENEVYWAKKAYCTNPNIDTIVFPRYVIDAIK